MACVALAGQRAHDNRLTGARRRRCHPRRMRDEDSHPAAHARLGLRDELRCVRRRLAARLPDALSRGVCADGFCADDMLTPWGSQLRRRQGRLRRRLCVVQCQHPAKAGGAHPSGGRAGDRRVSLFHHHRCGTFSDTGIVQRAEQPDRRRTRRTRPPCLVWGCMRRCARRNPRK